MDSPNMQEFHLNGVLGSGSEVGLDLSTFEHANRNPDQAGLNNMKCTTSTSEQLSQDRRRNPQSCDFCRIRKTACIVEGSLPCTTCRHRSLECTFARRRRKTRRTNVIRSSPKQNELHFDSASLMQNQSTFQPGSIPLPWQIFSAEYDTTGISTDELFIDCHDQKFTSSASPGSDTSETHRNALELPLDQPSWTFHLLGESSENDPQLFKRSTLAIHAENHHFRRFQRDAGSTVDLDFQRPIVFSLGRDHVYDNYEPRVEQSQLSKFHQHLSRITPEIGIRLVRLFFSFVYPYFPVLSHSQMLQNGLIQEQTLSDLPLSLKAVLYASACPYMVYDDFLSTMLDVDLPTSKELCRMSWVAITQEIHTPRLSTLQSCLLLLQRDSTDRYVKASPFQWSLLAWTVSLAQTLGLSTDCSTVGGMPVWEKRLRKRLWWATYALDKWNFACSGLASHIHKDDYDVLPLTDFDLSSSEIFESEENQHTRSHFRHLVELSVILSDVTDSFFTVKASKNTTSNFSMTCTLADELGSRLSEWKASFDSSTSFHSTCLPSRTRLDGNASLGLAYWAVHLLIMRAILRSLESKSGTFEEKQMRTECSESIRSKAEAHCVEAVEFIDQLQAGAWNAFWHKFSPSNFAIVSSSLLRLLVTSTTVTEKQRLSDLIDRWRWVLRSGGGNVGSIMMSLGLLCLDRTLLNSRAKEQGSLLPCSSQIEL